MILSAYLRSYVKYDGASSYEEHTGSSTRLFGNEHFLWTEPIASNTPNGCSFRISAQ